MSEIPKPYTIQEFNDSYPSPDMKRVYATVAELHNEHVISMSFVKNMVDARSYFRDSEARAKDIKALLEKQSPDAPEKEVADWVLREVTRLLDLGKAYSH